jgi:hypothetical protein
MVLKRDPAPEIQMSTSTSEVLPVDDAAVWENVGEGAFGAKLTVALGED